VSFFKVADMNLDEQLDALDIETLVLAFNDPDTYFSTFGVPGALGGDADYDGDLDFDDLDDFLLQHGRLGAGDEEST
jgi:hypothetical protein